MGWICGVNGKNIKGLKKIFKVEYVCKNDIVIQLYNFLNLFNMIVYV